jgi:molybdate transport system substrate-binding protein
MKGWFLATFLSLWATLASAGEVTVAVASNFLTTAEAVAAAFEAKTGHTVSLSHGATGLLYAQIEAGAPFGVFLSGDRDRPARLLAAGRAIEARTYATGHLALVSRLPVTRETAAEVFAGRTVALADPIVAPYGLAATRAMEKLRLDTATFRPVLVANVGQVASVFVSGNADLAFVAVSQLPRLDAPFVLPLDGIAPGIPQDAALLSDDEAARAFWDFLFSPESRALIEAAGYTPE